jgi:hypothetical protein
MDRAKYLSPLTGSQNNALHAGGFFRSLENIPDARYF